MINAPTCALVAPAKTESISSGVRTGCDDTWSLNPGARVLISSRLAALSRLVGFHITPTREALGPVWGTIWGHFPLKFVPTANESPVMFPPGRARLWTNPEPTGSPDTV